MKHQVKFYFMYNKNQYYPNIFDKKSICIFNFSIKFYKFLISFTTHFMQIFNIPILWVELLVLYNFVILIFEFTFINAFLYNLILY
jgi:hypothetical protein